MQKVLYTLFFISCFYFPSHAADCYDGRYKNKVFSDFTLVNNVIYARKQRSDGMWQNLGYDVYLPKNDTVTNRPVVVLGLQFVWWSRPQMVEPFGRMNSMAACSFFTLDLK